MDLPNNLLPVRSQRVDYAIGQHFLRVLPGVLPSHLLNPDFWVHLAAKYKVDDRVEVVAADGAYEAEFRVMAIDPRGLWIQMRPIRFCLSAGVHIPGVETTKMPVLEVADPDGYIIEFGGAHKWRIIRGGDVVEKMLPTKEAAIAKLAEIKAGKAAA